MNRRGWRDGSRFRSNFKENLILSNVEDFCGQQYAETPVGEDSLYIELPDLSHYEPYLVNSTSKLCFWRKKSRLRPSS